MCVKQKWAEIQRQRHTWREREREVEKVIETTEGVRDVYLRSTPPVLEIGVAEEELSRGSDEGSRKRAAGCLVSTRSPDGSSLRPMGSNPDLLPCLLLSISSFPKKASCSEDTRKTMNRHQTHGRVRAISVRPRPLWVCLGTPG